MLCCMTWEFPRAPPGQWTSAFYRDLVFETYKKLTAEMLALETAISQCRKVHWRVPLLARTSRPGWENSKTISEA